MGDRSFAGGLGGPSLHRPLAVVDWQMIPGLVGMLGGRGGKFASGVSEHPGR